MAKQKRNKPFTKGLEDVERTFEVLKDQKRKDDFKAWLERKKAEKSPQPKGGGERGSQVVESQRATSEDGKKPNKEGGSNEDNSKSRNRG